MECHELFKGFEYYNEVYQYISETNSSAMDQFQVNLKKAEKDTFDKILVSMVRESLLPFKKGPVELKKNQINRFEFSGLSNNTQFLEFQVNQVFGFDFFTFDHPVEYSKGGEVVVIKNCIDLIDLLKENPSFKDIDQYKIEIVNSISNMGLISTLCSDILNEIKEKGKRNQYRYISDYVDSKVEEDQLFDKFLFYDQIHLNGHHIHPCFKIRWGLTCKQVIEYSYELQKEIPIRFVGLHRSVGRFSLVDEKEDPTNYFLNLFPSTVKPIIQFLNSEGLELQDYLIYPMYPFQVIQTFPNQFKEELESKTLLIFPETISVPSFPTSSLRNLIPILPENQFPPHIKFSVPIQTTNFVRFMPNEFIPIGTSTSKILDRISSLEGSFKDKVVFLKELGGIYHKNEELRYQNFAIIWKENCNIFLRSSKDQPISSCSLFNPSPISNSNSILSELLIQYSESHSQILSRESIRSWFKEYATILIEPNLILFTKYGIGLESHLQNSVVVYNNGKPLLIQLKDWSGIRVKIDRLLKQRDQVGISLIHEIPKEIQLEDMEFYKMFSHSILHNHICQIIISICKDFPNISDENELWKDTFDIFTSTFSKMSQRDPSLKEQINQDSVHFFGKTLKCKALTGMRLLTNNQVLLPFTVKNPLNSFLSNE